jgi:transposase-like protein
MLRKEEKLMVMIKVKCPICGGEDISKNGIDRKGNQRYICNTQECSGKSFMLEYTNNGCKPGIEKQIIDMTANASGIRDISRNLSISTYKVMNTLKKLKT